MSHFSHHMFFCLNQREQGQACCHRIGSSELLRYAKDKIKRLDWQGKTPIRVSRAGCLGRCDLGPVLVIYPEAVWYTYVDQEDIDEIIDQHLLNGQPVERLRI